MLLFLKDHIPLPLKVIGKAQLAYGFVMEGTVDRIVFLKIPWCTIVEIDAYAASYA